MNSSQLGDCDQYIGVLNQVLQLLQTEGRFPSYSMKTKPVQLSPGSNAIEWRFYTWDAKTQIEFDWKRIYPHKLEGIPMHHFQVVGHDQFINDINELMLDLMAKYPAISTLLKDFFK